jgi:tRNA-dihydrouridine synthase B
MAAEFLGNTSALGKSENPAAGVAPGLSSAPARPVLGGTVNFPVCLAPMVGLSHVALRLLVRRYLPAGAKTIWPTEMLNSKRLPSEDLGATAETLRAPGESELVPQILGNEEDDIAASIAALVRWGADGIDINMGCPVRKALRHNYGVALMGDPTYAAEVVGMAARAARTHSPNANSRSELPVSVKLRAGFQSDSGYLTDFVQGLEAKGAGWIALHPRQAAQKRRGSADWSQITLVREKVRLPVIGNGDVQTASDVRRMRGETGCDMVMVGRALTARPWLMWQLGEELGWPPPPGFEGRACPRTPEEEGREFGEALFYFVECLETYFPESMEAGGLRTGALSCTPSGTQPGLKRLNFHLRNAHPWLEFGHALAASLSRAHDYAGAKTRVREFFSQPQRMSAETELRY